MPSILAFAAVDSGAVVLTAQHLAQEVDSAGLRFAYGAQPEHLSRPMATALLGPGSPSSSLSGLASLTPPGAFDAGA